MVEHKKNSKRPQPQHKRSQKKSLHDKQNRLKRRNANRTKTRRAMVSLTGVMHHALLMLRAVLDKRMAFRLSTN